MDVGLWVELPGGFDECVNKVVVFLASDALLPQAEVEVVVEKLLVVGSAV